jgi:hypothetical protein
MLPFILQKLTLSAYMYRTKNGQHGFTAMLTVVAGAG